MSAEIVTHPSRIDDRYEVQNVVGRGGMAIVYKVLDLKTRQEVALKRLLRNEDSESLEAISELFEHEFYTLTQLAHPGVIKVFNYGQYDSLPYYTMELLDGGDLREMTPIAWKDACSLLITVCSALGLLHSRRQVHRDVTPRNIRCTRDKKAKLMDFGAMAPMGPCKRPVGTAAYTSPEVVGLQTLDARADLYSLGATFYFILTGRNAYPARSFDDLHDLWRTKPLAPSEFVEGIPDALDLLVLSLIELDLMARPTNTAEVMERLGAIAGIKLDEELLVPQAYLSTPTLVGRDKPLARVRKKALRALGGQGSAIAVDAEAGVGRSRFLDACVLEGKLLGATIVKADASDAGSGDWAVARSLAIQLLDALPEIALEAAGPYVSVLGQVIPELVSRYQDKEKRSSEVTESGLGGDVRVSTSLNLDQSAEVWGRRPSLRPVSSQPRASLRIQSSGSSQELRPRIQAALRDWVLEVSHKRCLLIAVDDVHRIDEPSAAFVAMLSQAIADKRVVVAVTAEAGAPSTAPAAMKVLKAGGRVTLRKLSADDTEKLIGSVFGKTANVRLIADKLQAIAGGNPRTIMHLAQHLLDKRIVRYQAGSWTLPSSLDDFELPNSLSEALKARLQNLSEDALKLAQTMALSPDRGFCYEECDFLAFHRDAVRLLQSLDELVTRQILSTDEAYYSFSQQGWIPVLTEGLDEESRRTFHLRLAEMFEKLGNDQFRVGQHLLRAGEDERALDILIGFSEKSKAQTARDPGVYRELLQALPSDWYDTLDTAIALAEKRGRPFKQINIMRSRVSGIFGVTGTSHTGHTTRVLDRYYYECGLDIYQQLGDSVPTQERLGRALKMAQLRYDSTPEAERLLAPSDAIRALAATLIEAIGIVYISDSFSFWQTLPSVNPLVPLSPAVGVVEKCREAIGHCVAGRFEKFHQLYIEVLARLEQPDQAKLEGAHYQWLRIAVIHAIAIMEAIMGLESVFTRLSALDTFPLLQVNGSRIGKLSYLWQSNSEEAEKCQKKVELLQIQNSPSHYYQGTNLCAELRAYCCADDLTGIKQVMGELEKIVSRFPNWIPAIHYARGEYQRIRGDFSAALSELDKALKLTAPGENQNWAFIASGYLRTLLALGRHVEAEAEGNKLLQEAERVHLGYVCTYVRMPLAIAQAKLGDVENAVGNAVKAIDVFTALGTTGLSLGLAYETRARIAIVMGDRENYRAYADLCARQYNVGHNPALSAKYRRLIREGQAAMLEARGDVATPADKADVSTVATWREIASMIEACSGAEARAKRAMELLVAQGNCIGGFLYTIQNESPVFIAQTGSCTHSVEIDVLVRKRLAAEIDGTNDETVAIADSEVSGAQTDWSGVQDERYRLVLLGHRTSRGYALTGLAVLLTDANRPFRLPNKAASAISKFLLDAGDVSAVYTVT